MSLPNLSVEKEASVTPDATERQNNLDQGGNRERTCMRILKKNGSQGELKKSTKRPAGIAGIGNFAVTTVLMVAVVLMLSGGIIHYRYQQAMHGADVLQARTMAEGVAGRLADQIALYSSVISRFADDPRLVQLLAAEHWKDLQQWEQRLSNLLPKALAVGIYPVDWDGAGPDPRLSLSFASLEMLKQVERQGEATAAEVHKVGTDQQHIALAAPITQSLDGKVTGVLLLALPFELLEQAIQGSGDAPGFIGLQQLSASKAVSLVTYPRQQTPAADMDGEIAVSGTIWRAVYWGSAGTAGWKGLAMLLQVLGVALALIGLLVYLLSKRLGRVLSERFSLSQAALLQAERVTKEQAGVASEAVEATPQAAVRPSPAAEESVAVKQIPPESIFRAYDIRGVVGEALTEDGVFSIGQAIGTAAFAQEEQTVIIGRDARESSRKLSDALARGLTASGRDVVDLGEVPTPVLYFATHFLGASSGVIVTGSHNPPEYNGLKVVIGRETLSLERIQELRRLILEDGLLQGEGSVQELDLIADYIDRVSSDVQLLRPLKLVVDCGNGVASLVAPALFQALGCEVTALFCELDGRFPNHHPDPADPENMQALIQAVRERGADLGVAFDGDGDRLGVVDSSGKIIWPDRLLMLLARDVLLRQPGADVIYDIKSSRHLAGEILTYGGRPIMWKSGHSLIEAKLRETGALLAGEMSGHIFFRERWYGFDDALYSCARLLEVLSAEVLSSAELFAQLPESVSTPELYLALPEEESVALVQRFIDQGQFADAKLITIDGIRVEFVDGWGLLRSSNTTPAIMFRFEADSTEAMERIQGVFRQQLLALEPSLELPF